MQRQTPQPDPEPNPHYGPAMRDFLPSLLRLETAVQRFLEVTLGERQQIGDHWQ